MQRKNEEMASQMESLVDGNLANELTELGDLGGANMMDNMDAAIEPEVQLPRNSLCDFDNLDSMQLGPALVDNELAGLDRSYGSQSQG